MDVQVIQKKVETSMFCDFISSFSKARKIKLKSEIFNHETVEKSFQGNQ